MGGERVFSLFRGTDIACRDMNVPFVPLSLASLTADDYEEEPAIFLYCTVNAVCEYRPATHGSSWD